jgi:hypothetical protein
MRGAGSLGLRRADVRERHGRRAFLRARGRSPTRWRAAVSGPRARAPRAPCCAPACRPRHRRTAARGHALRLRGAVGARARTGRAGTRVLIVRGGDEAGQPTGRDWLANEIDAAGGRATPWSPTVGCRRCWTIAQLQLGSTVPKAARSGSSAAPKPSATCARDARHRLAPRSAVATHARIGEAARAAGFGALRVCTPLRDALVASIESLA